SQRAHHQNEVHERVQQGEQICAELAQLAQSQDDGSSDKLNEEFARLQHDFKALGTLPRDQHQRLQDQFNKAAQSIRQTLQRQQIEQKLGHWRELAQRVEELARFEDAAVTGHATDEPPVIAFPDAVPAVIREQ